MATATSHSIDQILDALRRIIRTLRLADRDAEQRLGLSGAQLFTLQQLGRSPGLSVNELAALTHTHQSSVSVVARRLVERGLVMRRRSPADARQVELRVTPAGRALLRRSPVTPQARLIEALERIPSPALRKLAGLLQRLVRETGAGAEPASMFFEDEGPRRSRVRPTRRKRG
jgi:DNA-binding MarR family transcriptional regulator